MSGYYGTVQYLVLLWGKIVFGRLNFNRAKQFDGTKNNGSVESSGNLCQVTTRAPLSQPNVLVSDSSMRAPIIGETALQSPVKKFLDTFGTGFLQMTDVKYRRSANRNDWAKAPSHQEAGQFLNDLLLNFEKTLSNIKLKSNDPIKSGYRFPSMQNKQLLHKSESKVVGIMTFWFLQQDAFNAAFTKSKFSSEFQLCVSEYKPIIDVLKKAQYNTLHHKTIDKSILTKKLLRVDSTLTSADAEKIVELMNHDFFSAWSHDPLLSPNLIKNKPGAVTFDQDTNFFHRFEKEIERLSDIKLPKITGRSYTGSHPSKKQIATVFFHLFKYYEDLIKPNDVVGTRLKRDKGDVDKKKRPKFEYLSDPEFLMQSSAHRSIGAVICWLAEQPEFKDLVHSVFPELLPLFEHYRPVVDTMIRTQEMELNEGYVDDHLIEIALSETGFTLSPNEISSVVKLHHLNCVKQFYGKSLEDPRRKAAAKLTPREINVGSQINQMTPQRNAKLFFRNVRVDLMEILRTTHQPEDAILESLESIVDQIHLYRLEDEPDSKTDSDGNRAGVISKKFVKWILNKPPYCNYLSKIDCADKEFLITEDDRFFFNDFENIRSLFENDSLARPLQELTLEECRDLTKILFFSNLLWLFEVDNALDENPEEVWKLLKTESNRNTVENGQKIEQLFESAFDYECEQRLSVSLDKHDHPLNISTMKFNTIDFRIPKFEDGEIKDMDFRDADRTTGREFNIGKSPSSESEILATIKLGIEKNYGCIQYVSEKRVSNPGSFKTPSIVEYLKSTKAEIDEGIPFALDNLDIIDIEEITHSGHEAHSNCVLVSVKDSKGEIRKIAFTEIGLPYQQGGLSKESIKAGIEIDFLHREAMDNNLNEDGILYRPRHPIILSRGGINRCIQHAIASEQNQWLENRSWNIIIGKEHESYRQGEFDTDRLQYSYRKNTDIKIDFAPINELKLSTSQSRIPAMIRLARLIRGKEMLGNSYAFSELYEYTSDMKKENEALVQNKTKDL